MDRRGGTDVVHQKRRCKQKKERKHKKRDRDDMSRGCPAVGCMSHNSNATQPNSLSTKAFSFQLRSLGSVHNNEGQLRCLSHTKFPRNEVTQVTFHTLCRFGCPTFLTSHSILRPPDTPFPPEHTQATFLITFFQPKDVHGLNRTFAPTNFSLRSCCG